MHTVHHHIEFRPVIAVLLGNAPVEIQHLPADPHAQRGRRLPQRPNLVIPGQKRPRNGVHHAHDVMIGREQARQTLGGQIVGNRAINPSPYLFYFDFDDSFLSEDNKVALIGIIGSLCAMILILILIISDFSIE